jgi:uncharacterized protein
MAYDERAERQIALRLTAGLLAALAVFKSLAFFPVLGTIAATLLAVAQLYIPLWRCDVLKRSSSFVGLTLRTWKRDLKAAMVLGSFVFPLYALGQFVWLTQLHTWLEGLGLGSLAKDVPQMRLVWPSLLGVGQFVSFAGLVLTHTIGVALPEETFYRGYLQPRLEGLWPNRYVVFGTPFGRGAVITSLLFACGHFLGEWNLARLLPFFPGLLFGWLRNHTNTVIGAIVFHAACNIFSALFFHLYVPF